MAELAITNLISNKCEWNNCFINNVPKYRKLVETKSKNAPKLTRLVTIFAEHGIIIPETWPRGLFDNIH